MEVGSVLNRRTFLASTTAAYVFGTVPVRAEEDFPSGKGKVVSVRRADGENNQIYASAVVCNSRGEVVNCFTRNDPNEYVRVHSALKPFDVALMLKLINEKCQGNYKFSPRELAIMCASHGGSEEQIIEVVNAISTAGLPLNFLISGRGRELPPMGGLRDLLLKRRIRPDIEPFLGDQCSGHHTCLATMANILCGENNNFSDPNGTFQSWHIRELKRHAQCPDISFYKFDNCNIPTFEMPLGKFAAMLTRLATDPECRPAIQAMTDNPFLTGDDETLSCWLMHITKGKLISKGGYGGIIFVLNTKTKECMVFKDWTEASFRKNHPTIQALYDLRWITEQERNALLSDKVLEKIDPKHKNYEHKEGLWGGRI